MKITSANIEHAWVHAQKNKGRAGNVSFEGPDIYSYSTIMGRVVHRPKDPNAPGVVLLNVRRYSVTTSGHQYAIRWAIPGHWVTLTYEGGSGSYYGYGSGDPGDPAKLILSQWDALRKALRTMAHPSEAEARADLGYLVRLQTAARLIGGAALGRVRRFDLDAFDASLPWADNAARWAKAEAIRQRRSEGAQKAAETRRKNADANRAARWAEYAKQEAERAERAAANLERWKAGERVDIGAYRGPIVLRVRDGEVETSNGAAIPASAARMIFAAWSAGKLLPGQHAGAYTVQTVQADHFVAGCTRIERAEAERIAKAQGWA